MKAAEIVRDETASRRLAEKTAKGARLLVEYYESIAPFLLDYKYERTEEEEREAEQWTREYSEEERTDPATRFLAKDEFLTLSSVERNQRALDRYWTRPHYPDELGRMYERYVGYLAEANGYEVSYTGIMQGFEDLGRDLVCQRGNETRIIQCKYWSRHRTIHEKHIFQLFGSVCMYRIKNPNAQVAPEFFTTTSLSDVARDVATLLDVSVHENQILDRSYPVIKCNTNPASRERIYHLPFDQQYDFTKIKRGTGELYCSTVAEAEGAGFRRAFRYRGLADA